MFSLFLLTLHSSFVLYLLCCLFFFLFPLSFLLACFLSFFLYCFTSVFISVFLVFHSFVDFFLCLYLFLCYVFLSLCLSLILLSFFISLSLFPFHLSIFYLSIYLFAPNLEKVLRLPRNLHLSCQAIGTQLFARPLQCDSRTALSPSQSAAPVTNSDAHENKYLTDGQQRYRRQFPDNPCKGLS